MKIAIGNDHAGVELKNTIVSFLQDLGHEIVNVGTDDDKPYPYAVSGFRVAKLVASQKVERGVLICGTGVGISLAANKVKGIRACVCSEPCTAKLSKQHNDTNIIAFGSRIVGAELAKAIVTEWLSASYEGGRHNSRIAMLSEIEDTQELHYSN